MIKDFFNKVFNLGIEHAQTISEKKRVRLLNQLVTICLTICTIVLINELVKGDLKGFFFDIVVISPIPICFYLNKKGWLGLAKKTYVIFTVVLLTSALIFYGRECGAEYAYLVAVGFTFIFFLERKEVILMNLFILFNFVLAEIYLYYNEPIYPVIHIPNLPLMTSLICQAVIVFAFVEENKIFDKNTEQLLNELSGKNQALDKQKKITEAKNEALVKANKELESFAYATSHDLRSPLRNIVSFIDLFMLKEGGDLSSKGKEYLDFVRGSAKHMNQLVDDILTHASLNSEDVNELIDLNHLIRDICKSLPSINNGKAKVILGDLPTIHASKIKIRLLFQNLIENGIKYNINERPEVHISAVIAKGQLKIKVKDNGIGIEQKYHDQIFQMFKRLHNQHEYSGTGIGLATCKKIVESYGGTITLNRDAEEGTTFVIHFASTMVVDLELI